MPFSFIFIFSSEDGLATNREGEEVRGECGVI